MNLKALRRNPLGLIAVLLLIGMVLLVISLNVMGSGRYSSNDNPLRDSMNNWLTRLNSIGANALIESGELENFSLPDGGNLLLLDSSGKVLYRMNDLFIGNSANLHPMISNYAQHLLDWSSKGGEMTEYTDTRLALLTDAQGNITGTLRCVASPDAPNVGEGSPKYSEYFPELDRWYYQDAQIAIDPDDRFGETSTYDWSNLGASEAQSEIAVDLPLPEPYQAARPSEASEYGDFGDYADNGAPPDRQMAQKVRDYVQWENAQLARAGNMRLVYRGPAWDGTQMLVIYPDSDMMHSEIIAYHRSIERSNMLARIVGAMLVLFILALAGWVFVDAKRRDFRPALWGILTLLGNVVAWLVYMLVRPNGRAAKGCPGCGAAIRGHYAYCANCGAQLCETCSRCDKVLEPSFHFCPHCGKAVIDPAENPQ